MVEIFQFSLVVGNSNPGKLPEPLVTSRRTRVALSRLFLLSISFLLMLWMSWNKAGCSSAAAASGRQAASQSGFERSELIAKGAYVFQTSGEVPQQRPLTDQPDGARERFVHEGISVEFSLRPVSGQQA